MFKGVECLLFIIELFKKSIKRIKKSANDGRENTNSFKKMKRNEALAQLGDIDPKSLLTTTKKSKKTLKIADTIMDNNFYLLDGLDIIQFEDKIDWNYTHPKASNTYKLYIQCLNVLSYLVDAYQQTKEEKYLFKAKEILWDWINYITYDKTNNKFKWVDHSVSNRVINIIYLYSVGHEIINLDEEKIIPLLIKHGEYLEDDNNYTPNNHGIMVDRSLIYLSAFLKNYKESQNWFEKARYRIINALYRDFSKDGVHLENSPAYHTMTRRIYRDIENSLQSLNMTLGPEVHQMLEKSYDYIKLIMKPNNELPLIGDTQKNKISGFEKSYESFQDKQAGITIIQNKNKQNLELSTWLAFICGYGSTTHKHRDDLSFTLFHKGEDVFIDSGRYNYDKNNEIRKYLLSSKAHNTFTVSDEEYDIKNPYENRNDVKTTEFIDNESYSYVKGKNKAFKGTSLSRSILYIKPDIIIIKDTGKSDKQKEFEQIFNLSPTIRVESNSENSFYLVGEKNKISINQFNYTRKPSIVNGDENIPIAVFSEKFGEISRSKQLIYKATGKEVEFITVINLNEKADDDIQINYIKESSKLSINYNGQFFSIVI